MQRRQLEAAEAQAHAHELDAMRALRALDAERNKTALCRRVAADTEVELTRAHSDERSDQGLFWYHQSLYSRGIGGFTKKSRVDIVDCSGFRVHLQ